MLRMGLLDLMDLEFGPAMEYIAFGCGRVFLQVSRLSTFWYLPTCNLFAS